MSTAASSTTAGPCRSATTTAPASRSRRCRSTLAQVFYRAFAHRTAWSDLAQPANLRLPGLRERHRPRLWLVCDLCLALLTSCRPGCRLLVRPQGEPAKATRPRHHRQRRQDRPHHLALGPALPAEGVRSVHRPGARADEPGAAKFHAIAPLTPGLQIYDAGVVFGPQFSEFGILGYAFIERWGVYLENTSSDGTKGTVSFAQTKVRAWTGLYCCQVCASATPAQRNLCDAPCESSSSIA